MRIGSLLVSSREVARLDSVTAPGLLAYPPEMRSDGVNASAVPVAPMVSIAGPPLALQPSMFRGAEPSAKSYCPSRARVSRSTDLTQAGIQYACTNHTALPAVIQDPEIVACKRGGFAIPA